MDPIIAALYGNRVAALQSQHGPSPLYQFSNQLYYPTIQEALMLHNAAQMQARSMSDIQRQQLAAFSRYFLERKIQEDSYRMHQSQFVDDVYYGQVRH